MHRNRVWISTTILLLACALSAVAQIGNTSTGTGASPTTIGDYNTADGYNALNNNAQSGNTAVGAWASQNNQGAFDNTAVGSEALFDNYGANNTAIGYQAGALQAAGSNNTFVGYGANIGPVDSAVPDLQNATAIGANAEVQASNSMVLGSINGVNGATASTNVGIGTTTPAASLDINANSASSGEGTPPPGIHTYMGSACNSSAAFAGIAFGTAGFQNCANYSLLGDGTNTYINAPSGEILLRINNVNLVTMSDNGITIPGHITVGSLSQGSDRNLKEGFAPVDGSSLLTKLNGIPMQTWKYKTDSPSIRHLGPMAQDFRAAFGLGEDDKHISTIDEGGVALAAVQELYREGVEKDATIRDLQVQIAQLAAQVKMVQAALASSGQPAMVARTVSAQLASVR